MYVTIALIIWLIIGYFIGETVIYQQRKIIMKKNKAYARIQELYEKYVPETEKHKAMIIKLHNDWINGREIWRILKIDGSAINRALHRWKAV